VLINHLLTLGAKIRTPIPLSKLEIIHTNFFWNEINWEEKLSEVIILYELWVESIMRRSKIRIWFHGEGRELHVLTRGD
jgi:hypothetical protein